MAHAWRWLRSLVFIAQMYLMLAVLGLLFLPWALADRRGAFAAVHTYCNWVRWSARWIVGLRSELRGDVPQGQVLIAAKHQSFFDIILICSGVPRPKFIMKKSLVWAPVVGWYGMRIGCIPVNRGKRTEAIRQMMDSVGDGSILPGQLIIYPQGTRVAPGAARPYKIGTGVLYQQLAQPCVPAATNVGVFWPKHGITRKSGLAVVEFLPAIAPGKPIEPFMAEVEATIEAASDRLMAEAGFPVRTAP